MAFDWSWTDLITGVAGIVLGWLAKLLHGGINPNQGK